jgi:predicted metalloprotease with PDZ domain
LLTFQETNTMIRRCAALALLLWAHAAFAHDGKDNHYQVTVNADASVAHIDADVWIGGKELVLFNCQPIAALKNGQADLLGKIEVRDMAGKPLALSDKGEGEYEVAGDQRVTLSYDVRLEHARYDWPAGTEEVSYKTDEGLMASGYALFLVPGETMPGRTQVRFRLPPGWRATTPWKGEGDAYIAQNRRELVNNVFFLGTARAETFQSGGVEITLLMGKRYWPQRANMRELIERQLASYLAMFGAPPLAGRYLIIINQGDTGDGGAFAGSFSQFLKKNGEKDTRAIWGRVVAHELLHFWNGSSLVPAREEEEWFKEGVTDYLTFMTMARNGLLGREVLQQFLENLARGQLVARNLMQRKGTVREAVKDKHRNWLLVYGGGQVAALAMDVELRRASGGKTGLPQLMHTLYGQFGKAGKTYTQDDIVQAGRALAGVDLAPVLEKIVGSETAPDLAPLFEEIGMTLELAGPVEVYLLRKRDAPKAAHARFEAIFGMRQ